MSARPSPGSETVPQLPAVIPGTDRQSARLDTVFSALADPTRRAILGLLLEDDMAVTDVAAPFAISLAAISKHLMILADAGLISQEKRGRVKWCKLEPEALRDASVWMQGFGQFDRMDLDAFERFLDSELGTGADAGSEDAWKNAEGNRQDPEDNRKTDHPGG